MVLSPCIVGDRPTRISEVSLSVCDIAVSVCLRKCNTDTDSHEIVFVCYIHSMTLSLHRDEQCFARGVTIS